MFIYTPYSLMKMTVSLMHFVGPVANSEMSQALYYIMVDSTLLVYISPRQLGKCKHGSKKGNKK